MTIFCVAVGDLKYKDDALKVLSSYFSTNGIKLFVLEEGRKGLHPAWLKMVAHEYVDDDFILCWDLDLLPCVKHFSLGSYLDTSKINVCRDVSIQLTGWKFNPNFRFNSGLVGIPKSKAALCKAVFDRAIGSTYPSYEQYHFNDVLAETKEDVQILPQRFNALYPTRGIGQSIFDRAENKHYTWGVLNDSDKARLVKEHCVSFFEPPTKFQRFI